ncbi:hypothetical protein RWE87_13540 [Sinorhizobium meliloti]|uniref:hypothetical protein n=1 Tax=Rhizobium meliloti TaxID=382 RepID=UPI00299E699C
MQKIEPRRPTYQDAVAKWLLSTFGEKIANDPDERNQRFLEEAVELVQSLGATKQECHELVDYVFSRSKGEPAQEVGGVIVCLAALCNVAGLDMLECSLTELDRIDNALTMDKIKQKHKGKPKFGRLRFRDVGSPWDSLKDMTVEQQHAMWSKIVPG